MDDLEEVEYYWWIPPEKVFRALPEYQLSLSTAQTWECTHATTKEKVCQGHLQDLPCFLDVHIPVEHGGSVGTIMKQGRIGQKLVEDQEPGPVVPKHQNSTGVTASNDQSKELPPPPFLPVILPDTALTTRTSFLSLYHPGQQLAPSGLTPATEGIVSRRFDREPSLLPTVIQKAEQLLLEIGNLGPHDAGIIRESFLLLPNSPPPPPPTPPVELEVVPVVAPVASNPPPLLIQVPEAELSVPIVVTTPQLVATAPETPNAESPQKLTRVEIASPHDQEIAKLEQQMAEQRLLPPAVNKILEKKRAQVFQQLETRWKELKKI